jgi:hypothetical protein
MNGAREANERRRRWFTGLVIGLVFGLGTLIGGTLIGMLGLVAAGLLSVRPGRTLAIGGVLTGLGTCWLFLFVTADARCGPGCSGPDITPWLAASGAMLAIGVSLTALGWSRNRG